MRDTPSYPHEVRNVAGEQLYAFTLQRLRGAHKGWAREFGELGVAPEFVMLERMGPRAKYGKTEPVRITPSRTSSGVSLVRVTLS